MADNTHMQRFLPRLAKDSLVLNSLYPMVSALIMAALGFFFWLLVAHLFSTEEVGVAATLISVMSMVSVVSLSGFDTALIRFLAHAEKRNDFMNTAIILVSGVSLAFASLFVTVAPRVSPHLEFLWSEPATGVAFVLFSAFAALNILTDAMFLAFRETRFTLLINTIFSALKLLFPFIFLNGGAFGIFCAAALAQAVGCLISLIVLRHHFDYRPRLRFTTQVIRDVFRYSAHNFVADILILLPTTLMPLIVMRELGPTSSAYFSIVMLIASLLYVIPTSITRALFAEGSYNTESIPMNIRASVLLIVIVLTPAIALLALGGDLLLTLFGKAYSSEGLSLLHLTLFTSIALSMFSLYGSLFRIAKDTRALLVRNSIFVTVTFIFTYTLLPLGLVGIGWALLSGYLLASIVSALLYRTPRQGPENGNEPIARKTPFTHPESLLYKLVVYIDEAFLFPALTVLWAKVAYFRARTRPGFKKHTILFYPDAPKTYHTIYKICHQLGVKITTNTRAKFDCAIAFEDTTHRTNYGLIETLKRERYVINGSCNDIRKSTVDRVFGEVFGYTMSVDPRTFSGICVQKSDQNAVHDGRVVTCPTPPLPGYIYQILVNNVSNPETVLDYRVPIFNETIPFVIKRFKHISDRFDVTTDTILVTTEEILTPEERRLVIAFAKRMALDYGELDVLRDVDSGRLYIVDVNNTPAGPLGPIYHNKTDLYVWFGKLCETFEREFLQSGK